MNSPLPENVPSSSINIERLLVDHLPNNISELELEIQALLAQLIKAESKLIRLRIHQRIENELL